MSNKKIMIIGILIITALAVTILLQKGILNLRKNQNEQIMQIESGTSVSGAYTQTDENGNMKAYDSSGNVIARGILNEDGTIRWGLKATPDMYGCYVTDYTPKCGANSCVGWKIFYADAENVYLISDDFIKSQYMPETNDGKKVTAYNDYRSSFF